MNTAATKSHRPLVSRLRALRSRWMATAKDLDVIASAEPDCAVWGDLHTAANIHRALAEQLQACINDKPAPVRLYIRPRQTHHE